MTGSNWTRGIHRWNINGECLWDVSCSYQGVGGGLSPRKIEARGIRRMILAINAVKNGEYPRHSGGSYQTGGDGGSAFLSGDPLLHQPDVLLLLLDSAALRTQRGLENMM